MRALAIAVASSLSIFIALDANAFCRTTTTTESSGFNPSTMGCWVQGTPLAWHARDVDYVISAAASRQVALADAQRVIAAAFAKWSAAPCSSTDTTKHPSITVHDKGTVNNASTDCGLVQCDPTVHDTEHVVVFRDDAWPHNDPGNTLALTTVTFGVNSGEIFDADMEINTFNKTISTAAQAPAGAYDLETVVTHEAGHFLGMAHSDDAAAVMYMSYVPGRSTLTADDDLAVCTVYPPDAPTKAGCSCDAGASSSSAPAVAASALVLAALRRRRVRRATSSRGTPSGT
jgi:MYXO-CTERM domain-containing protein